MKKILGLVFTMLCSTSWALDCPSFTPEQNYLLQMGKAIGNQHHVESINDTIGFTVAAIIWKESFVGRHVVRFNTKDGEAGSWGVMMVQASTVLDMMKKDLTWATRASTVPNIISGLLNNDIEAIQWGTRYLKSRIDLHQTLWGGVRAYNGTGPRADRYAEDVKQKVLTLISCRDKLGLNY